MGNVKILAIKFKYLGDVALMVPALRALRENYPDAQLEVLVAEGAETILEHIPWIDKVWGFPKKKGKALIYETLPLLWKLRRNKYHVSVDFVGNDRGAIVSRIIGAKKRVGLNTQKGFLGRKYCYTLPAEEASDKIHESLRDIYTLKPLGLKQPSNFEPELYPNPELEAYSQHMVSKNNILCHLSTSRPKKEWPISSWIKLYHENPELHDRLVFTSGPSEREQALLKELKDIIPQAKTINPIPSVGHFIAIISKVGAIICCDSLPSHLASGLKTPAVVLFGPTTVEQWKPKGNSTVIAADNCCCLGHSACCLKKVHCLSLIEPKLVISALNQVTN